jgi:hypothetical protein
MPAERARGSDHDVKSGWATWRGAMWCAGAAAVLMVSGCGRTTPTGPGDYTDWRSQLPSGSIAGSDSGLLSLGTRRDDAERGAGLGVNAHLWRGALETLSFMPLVSADPFGGVIITDWYQLPGAGAERFKATAYILGRQLRADGVRVSVYRQVQQGGTWVDAAVSPSASTELENKVLARARDLRSQQVARE